jgi:hypothetical protein
VNKKGGEIESVGDFCKLTITQRKKLTLLQREALIAKQITDGGLVTDLPNIRRMTGGIPPFPGSSAYFKMYGRGAIVMDVVDRVNGAVDTISEICLPVVRGQLSKCGNDGIDVRGRVKESVFGFDTSLTGDPRILAKKIIWRVKGVGRQIAEEVEAQGMSQKVVGMEGWLELEQIEQNLNKSGLDGDNYGEAGVNEQEKVVGGFEVMKSRLVAQATEQPDEWERNTWPKLLREERLVAEKILNENNGGEQWSMPALAVLIGVKNRSSVFSVIKGMVDFAEGKMDRVVDTNDEVIRGNRYPAVMFFMKSDWIKYGYISELLTNRQELIEYVLQSDEFGRCHSMGEIKQKFGNGRDVVTYLRRTVEIMRGIIAEGRENERRNIGPNK